MIQAAQIRRDFPIFKRKVNGHPLVFLDNAAMTQKPRQVLKAINDFYKNGCSNIRAEGHTLSREARESYENARKTIAAFIGAEPEEIIFTRNTTESINLVANSLGSKMHAGDQVISSAMEHHSNIVPWQLLKEREGIRLDFAGTNADGTLRTEDYDTLISHKTRLITVTHCSNVSGAINDVRKIGKKAHKAGALFLVDGAQSVPHLPINVKELGCDFFAFSGYKMLGPTGIGVLYIRKEAAETMPPFMGGGHMIKEVSLKAASFKGSPFRFEAGTPSIADAIGLGAAADYLEKIGMKNVRENEKKLLMHAMTIIKTVENLQLHGPLDIEKRVGTLAFSINSEQGGISARDITTALDTYGIAVLSGYACAQPLVNSWGKDAITRASIYIYNTKQEINYLTDCLNKITHAQLKLPTKRGTLPHHPL